MPLESSSLVNWDGRISRGGESREDGLDDFGRTQRVDTDKDVDMDANIPGLGQIPSRAQEDEEQVSGLNLSARVSTLSDSRASQISPANSSNPDDLPSYNQSQRKYNALPHLPHRNTPSTSTSDNPAQVNMTYAQHLRTSSNADLIPLGPKANRKPASSNTYSSHLHPPLPSNPKAIDNPQSKCPPTGPRAETKTNSHVNSPDHRVMKGLPPTGSGELASVRGPDENMDLDKRRLPLQKLSFWRPADVGQPPLEGRDALQFNLPSSPLPHLSFPERGARLVEMEEPQDEFTMPDTQAVQQTTKDALQACVMVPRLSEAERRTYLHRVDESLGSTSLVLSNPACSVTSPQCQRRQRSSRPSSSSPTQPSSPLPKPPKRKAKFMDIQEGTAEYKCKVIRIPRRDTVLSTTQVGFSAAMAPQTLETAPPPKRRRRASPPRESHPPSDSHPPQDVVIASALSNPPCNRCITTNEPCTRSTVNGSERRPGPQRKSCDRCIAAKRACVIAPLSYEQAPVHIEEQESGKFNVDGPTSKPAEDVLCPEAEGVLVWLAATQSSPPSSIHSPSPDIDASDEHRERKGKARAVDDDAEDEIVELAIGKKGKLEGKGGELAEKARTEDMAYSTSSAHILTLEFREEMDDRALYSIMMEPDANDIHLNGAWNHEQSWGTEVHMIGSQALRRNLKGYRRVLLGTDQWYEGDEYEDYEEDCEWEPKIEEEEEILRALMLSGTEDVMTEDADLNGKHFAVHGGVVDTNSNTDTDRLDVTLVARRQATCALDNQCPAELGTPPLNDVVLQVQSEDNLAPPPVSSTSPEPARRRLTLDSQYPTRPDGKKSCCHQCRRNSQMIYMQCMNLECATVRGRTFPGKRYCIRCIRTCYNKYKFVDGEVDTCPACEGICSCDRCKKKKDSYEQSETPLENGPKGRPVRKRKR